MITTGSKFLVGSTVLAIVAAIAYGVTQDDTLGTIGLISAAAALAFLTGVGLFTRDANVWADEVSSIETAPAALSAPASSAWPFAFAFGAVVVTVGLVTQQSVFTVGVAILLATGAEWTTHAWSARASADAGHNAAVRSRVANPLEFPLGAAVGIGIIVFMFSRIMLWLSSTSSIVAFSLVGLVIILGAFLIAYRPRVKSKAAVGVLAIAVVGLVAGGVAAGVDGQREIPEHETAEELQAAGEGICSSPDEFPSDLNASQSVGASASLAAKITLDEAGELSYELNGPAEAGSLGLTLPRSNPNNVMFINKSGDERRLSASFGTMTVEDAAGAESTVEQQECTTLVKDGGRQNVTLIIDLPSSSADEGFFFFVPGVESARLELIVP